MDGIKNLLFRISIIIDIIYLSPQNRIGSPLKMMWLKERNIVSSIMSQGLL